MTGYLTSLPWFRRRDQWFADELERAGELRCVVCMKAGTKRDFELHHLSYEGVSETPHGWTAGESHADLVPAHPRCHEWIHRALDTDQAAGSAVSRRVANERVIAGLRNKIVGYLKGL